MNELNGQKRFVIMHDGNVDHVRKQFLEAEKQKQKLKEDNLAKKLSVFKQVSIWVKRKISKPI